MSHPSRPGVVMNVTEPACSAVLTNQQVCEKPYGHGGHHRWAEITMITIPALDRLATWLQRVALYSNDAWLAQEARAQYIELTGKEPRA